MAENARYAVIDANGVIQNIVLWDGETEWLPPEGMTAQLCVPDTAYFIGLKPGEMPESPPEAA